MDGLPLSLADRVAWITGGTSGLGFAAARLFAAVGARTILLARDEARGREASARIPGSRFVSLDVADAARGAETGARLLAEHGAPRVVLHAAGALVRGGVEELGPDDVRRVFGASVDGALNVLRAVLPAMAAAGGGSIVLVSSYLAERAGAGGMPAYNAAKAALLGLMRPLAVRHGPQGIRINAILPAFIETPLNRAIFDDAPDPAAKRAETAARYPLRRYGTPDDFAAAALFLASDASSWITGHGLVLDGGVSA
jgi:NAD(P)-dependent dehydrogenase (short-subunit alcohol dehydrogenase family)